MAINLRRLCRLNLSLANNIFSKSNFINVGIRSLYTEQDLGLTTYENARYIFRNQFTTIEDTFRLKMKEICEKEDGMVYTEDLKAMLHLARETEEDMELLTKMLGKYVKGKDDRKITVYAFGPVVMRMFYYLDQPKRALAMFENEEFSENFNYRSSFRTLMCLLFKHNMFKEMREVYDKVMSTKGTNFIGNNSVLIFAGCLKENTPEAFEYALEQWKQHYQADARPSHRTASLMSLLSIKNNASEVALEILSVVERDLINVRCLKILTYMHLQRYMQIMPIFQRVLNDDASIPKQRFFADVIYELEEKLKLESPPERDELLYLINDIKRHDFLETNCTLEEYLLKPMIINRQNKFMQTKNRPITQNNSLKRAMGGVKNYL